MTCGFSRMAAALLLKLRDLARFFLGSEPSPAMEDDDLLGEILLRVPPLPSSLLRASLVCKRWRRLVSDPQFLRRFRAHHQTPPLLGIFVKRFDGEYGFVPALDAPNQIPPARFSLSQFHGEHWRLLSCRHGLALLHNQIQGYLTVWDPITCRQFCIHSPPELKYEQNGTYYDAFLTAAGGAEHEHDYCKLSSFKVVLVCTNRISKRASACLYESESGKWSTISSTTVTHVWQSWCCVLVGNTLYWCPKLCRDIITLFWCPLLCSNAILEFDMDRQSLRTTRMPKDANVVQTSYFQVLRIEDRDLGLAISSQEKMQLWGRRAMSDDTVEWVLQKTVELDKLIPQEPSLGKWVVILGYDEDNNAIFVSASSGVYMIQLESLQFTKLVSHRGITYCQPYASFYTSVRGGEDEAETMNNT